LISGISTAATFSLCFIRTLQSIRHKIAAGLEYKSASGYFGYAQFQVLAEFLKKYSRQNGEAVRFTKNIGFGRRLGRSVM